MHYNVADVLYFNIEIEILVDRVVIIKIFQIIHSNGVNSVRENVWEKRLLVDVVNEVAFKKRDEDGVVKQDRMENC